MNRARPGILAEFLPVALVLLVVAGALALVLAVHRDAARARRRSPSRQVAAVVAPAPAPAPAPVAAPPSPQPPPPAPAPAAPPEDPTKPVLARLAAEGEAQREATRAADRRARALEDARRAAVAELERHRRREAMVRAQVDELSRKAHDLEADSDALAAERDVLLRERDAAKAALAKARAKGGGYAVLPHRAANGTWQRPVVLECRDGQATLQPKGDSFSLLDMSPIVGPSNSPLVLAVARELIRVHTSAAPDGDRVMPYIYFIVRPDGIRAYYQARARLEPLGIAFGYELVEQDQEIDFPDLDDLDAWDGTGQPRSKGGAHGPGDALARGDASPRPGDGRGDGRAAGTGAGNGAKTADGPEGFLWPTGPTGAAGARGLGGDGDGPNPARRGPTVAGLLGAGPGGEPPGPGEYNPDRLIRDAFGAAAAAGADDGPGLGFPEGSSFPRPPGFGGGAGSVRGGFDGSPLIEPPGSGLGRGPARGGPATDLNGLVPLSAGGLPGLEPPVNRPGTPGAGEDRPGTAGTGTGRAGAPSPPAGTGAGVPPGTDVPPGTPIPSGTGLPPLPPNLAPRAAARAGSLASAAAGSGSGSGTRATPPGRVRIDPDRLQAVDDPFGDAARDAGTLPGPRGDTPGRGAAGAAGSAPSAGVGQPSADGGGSPGLVGVGTPSPGAGGAGQGTTDVRPRRVPAPSWMPSRLQVDAPLEIVVACGPDGVVIHPGGYRLSTAAIRKPGALTRDLETIVHNHALIDPAVRPRPRIQFLIEPGGSETYQEARRQTVLSGLGWPVVLQVSKPPAPRIFAKERF